MSERNIVEDYESRSRQRGGEHRFQTQLDSDIGANLERNVYSASLVQDPKSRRSVNAPARVAAMQGMQQTHGNRAVQRTLAQRPQGDIPESYLETLLKDVLSPVSQRPQGGVPKWYGSRGGNKQGGYNFGGGYGVSGSESGEWWQRLGGDLPFISGNLLAWGENDDKDTRYGAKAEVGAGRLEYKGDGWSADGSAFGLNGEASVGSNGATFGGGATIVGGSATVGTFDPKSNTDTTGRFGLSAGPSFGVRGHWGDSDNDGHRELGAGADFGIFSVDLKTEDPLRTGIGMLSQNTFGTTLGEVNDKFGINNMLGGQYLPSPENDKSNWSEDALGWASGSDKPVTIDNAVSDSWKKLDNADGVVGDSWRRLTNWWDS